jgi:glucosamine--fructose-6-phosphate aminotransferase (isomerizing)
MCGIACFLSEKTWQEKEDVSWFERLCHDFSEVAEGDTDWTRVDQLLDELKQNFGGIMSFGFHLDVVSNSKSRERLENLCGNVRSLRDRMAAQIRESGRTDEYERFHEDLEDYLWQLDWEILRNADRSRDLMPESLSDDRIGKEQHFLAWSVEQVLENLDKLEVRGRDSAGIAIMCVLSDGADPSQQLTEDERAELTRRISIENAGSGYVLERRLGDGRLVYRFLYKVANLVGRLGDNTAVLRSAIREDSLLWKLLDNLEKVNIFAHTRWASNGTINIPNSHPVDGKVIPKGSGGDIGSPEDSDVMFVLNGDVDNYLDLVDSSVHSVGAEIHPSITTDAKILPVIYNLNTAPEKPVDERFRDVMQQCDGSLAVVMQLPGRPDNLYLAQKGSGQSLYIGRTIDAWVVASEPYGIAARCRSSYPMTTTEKGGCGVVLAANGEMQQDSDRGCPGTYLEDGGSFFLKEEPIEIFPRDIFRKDFDYFIEKEIHDAPQSVLKTIQGKCHKGNEGVLFITSAVGNGEGLLERLTSYDLPRIRRIFVVGQGTASIASMGIAFLLREAIGRSGIIVESTKASELFGFMTGDLMEDTLLIAVSQSGTTTDTNRIVDLARERGAWVHAIVNRRNSPLVRKANSHIYTSNGRDVEMAVASTKAYYSQIAAGKLMALWLAGELRTMDEREILSEFLELESLPDRIEEVLALKEEIASHAKEYAPAHRYWAVVGNGANRIAAEEIRIKLSELCYKSIPCDITEDKKHIDLSTEPLTIVVANHLPDQLIQDTVKEVTIFKAHNGRPLVFCSRGENRFDSVSEHTIKLPRIGAGLAFVLATVAGHTWGIEAAKAIDGEGNLLRRIRSEITRAMTEPSSWEPQALQQLFTEALDLIEKGRTDSALPARDVAAFARYVIWLDKEGPNVKADDARLPEALNILNRLVEETTRPVDTIRHQAKTVTVGISRPQEKIAAVIVASLESLGVMPSNLKQDDHRLLEVLSPVVSDVIGGLLYEVTEKKEFDSGKQPALLRAIKGAGSSKVEDSRYTSPQPARGVKRKVLRTGRAACTTDSDGHQDVIISPVYIGSGLSCSHEVLLHLEISPAASLQQKRAILLQLGNKYESLVELKEEYSIDMEIDKMIEGISPRDLIFNSVSELLRR